MKYLISLITIFFFLTSSQSQNFDSQKILLQNCNIIPMSKDTILKNKNIIIEYSRILKITDSEKESYSDENMRVIDCNEKYVMPGLFDSHFHYGRNEKLYPTYDSLLVHNGITNVFSFHGSKTLMEYRKKLNLKKDITPYVISTGRNQNDKSLTQEQASQIFKEHQKTGFKFIKIYTDLSREGFETFNELSKQSDIRLVGHIPRAIGFYDLMDSNQELISHVEELLYNEPIKYLMGIDSVSSPKYHLADNIASTLKKNEKWISPTLITFKSIINQTKESNFQIDSTSSINQIAKYWNWLPPENKIPSKFNTRNKQIRLEKGFKFQQLLVEQLSEYNAKILAGTDSPAYWNLIPGESLHQELKLLNQCGLSEFETLQTATINPAKFLHIDKRFGTVEPNKNANLLILNENPLENINNTTDIYKVIINGKVL